MQRHLASRISRIHAPLSPIDLAGWAMERPSMRPLIQPRLSQLLEGAVCQSLLPRQSASRDSTNIHHPCIRQYYSTRSVQCPSRHGESIGTGLGYAGSEVIARWGRSGTLLVAALAPPTTETISAAVFRPSGAGPTGSCTHQGTTLDPGRMGMPWRRIET